MSSFDEKKGVVSCKTAWGQWWQTVDEIQIEVDHPETISGKDVSCKITSTTISCSVKGKTMLQGKLLKVVKTGDSTWVLEDKRKIRILLAKAKPGADNCWESLFEQEEGKECFLADAWTLNEMQKSLTLERYQNENPGMDFSGADITGNYQHGGPVMPQ